MLLLLYVDDIIVIGDNPSFLSHFLRTLGSAFAMKDLGPLHYFLGVEVTHFDGGIFLSQLKYAFDLLTCTKMENSRPIETPQFEAQFVH